MSMSLSQLTTSVFVQGLEALDGVLAKAEHYAAGRKIDEAALLQDRLFPDMFPMVWQVRTACDFAKGCVCRLAGHDIPSLADDETSFAALRGRVAKTLEIVRGVPTAAIDAGGEREVSIGRGDNVMRFHGQDYLLTFALPNFYFHLTTAYALLRHNGVEVGKRDFVGAARTL